MLAFFLSAGEIIPFNAFVYDLLSVSSFIHIFDMLLFVRLERGFIGVCSEVSK